MLKGTKNLIVFAVAVLMLATVAWGRKFALTIAPTVPAAKGDIDVTADKNGNTQVDLKVENMANPSSLTPPATAYVIWFVEEGEQPHNQGELRISGNLKGDFKTTTSMKNFEVFGTAESDPMTKTPTGQRVFHATVQR